MTTAEGRGVSVKLCNICALSVGCHGFSRVTLWISVKDVMVSVELRYVCAYLRRVLDIYCQIDSSQCLAQLTPARVGKARSVHVQLGASQHVIR